MPPLAMPALLSGCFRSAASTADRENHEKITNDILLDAAEDAREDARAQIKQKSLDSHSPNTSGSSTILFVTTAPRTKQNSRPLYWGGRRPTDEADCSPIFRRCLSTTSSRRRARVETEYSLIDSAATSPM